MKRLYRFTMLEKLAAISDTITLLEYNHISIDVAMVLLQNPPFWSDQAIVSLLNLWENRPIPYVDQYRYRGIGQSEIRTPLLLRDTEYPLRYWSAKTTAQ